MRKLIPLFLSLFLSVYALAATDKDCNGKAAEACGQEPGCGWEKTLVSGKCEVCQENTYSEKVPYTLGADLSVLACQKCSDITQYTNPDTSKVTTYWTGYYTKTSGTGQGITGCYAECTELLANLNEQAGAVAWMLTDTNTKTAYYPNECPLACYTSGDDYNTCASYYHPFLYEAQKYDTTVCEPSWIFMNSPAEITSKLPSDATRDYTYFCKNAQTGIYMELQAAGIIIMCSAQSCQTGYHLESVQDVVNNELPGMDADQYYCKSGTLDIPSETLFQKCTSDTRPCSDDLGAKCEITIDGKTYTGNVGGNAIWNSATKTYDTNQCTCTVSAAVTEGTYAHVCKRSTTSNTWDGTSCETTITTCNSGYCIVGYDANNKNQRCAAAPRGYYSDGRGVLECNKCPAGKTTSKTNTTNASGCTYTTGTEFCDSVGCFNLEYTSLTQ